MIEVLGDRRNTGFCLMCGTDLIVPWNDYQCCTKCTDKITHCRVVPKKRGLNRKVGKAVLSIAHIMRQIKPIGGMPQ